MNGRLQCRSRDARLGEPARDGNDVRVTIRRLQEPPGVELDQVWWVGPDASGRWLIWKELAEVPGSGR